MTIAPPSFFRKGISVFGCVVLGCLTGLGLSTLEYIAISSFSNALGLFFFAHPVVFRMARTCFFSWPIVGALGGLAYKFWYSITPRWLCFFVFPIVGFCLGVTLYSGVIAVTQYVDETLLNTNVVVVALIVPFLGGAGGIFLAFKTYFRKRTPVQSK